MRKSNQPSALIHLIGSLALVASSQALAALASSAVTVSHGWVTDYHLSHWEDPNLPVGVLRGLGPRDQDMTTQSPELDQSETDGLEASRSDETTAPGGHTAILYTLDLNERGMQMVVSTKTTLQPGDCAALERTEEVINLRRVSPAFCDPANQEIVTRLLSLSIERAARCIAAREADATQPTMPAVQERLDELAMLCDGG